ncbi:hypothetical protein ANCCEY_14267, partial [Ancylostoma ceylanicum]
AFVTLKFHLPSLRTHTKRVSKLKILNAAIRYIDSLVDLLKVRASVTNQTHMCPELSLSPVKWRRRSWRTMVATARKEPITPSVPVSTRIQELEKRGASDEDTKSVKDMLQRVLDMLSTQQSIQEKNDNEMSNTSEELEATLSELEEAGIGCSYPE